MPVRSFLRDITSFPWACENLVAGAAHHFRNRLPEALTVIHVSNDRLAFLENMEHQHLIRTVRAWDRNNPRFFNDMWRMRVLEKLSDRFALPPTFSVAAEVHCECSLLAYIDTHAPDGLYCFIGLSQPPCLPCSELLALYNARGGEFAMNNVDVDEPGKWIPWSPLRMRSTDKHVSLPWVAPRIGLDLDGRISLRLQAILSVDLQSAWRSHDFHKKCDGDPLANESADQKGKQIPSLHC